MVWSWIVAVPKVGRIQEHGIHAAHTAEQHILKASVADRQSSALKQEMLVGMLKQKSFSVTHRKNEDMSCGSPVGQRAQRTVNTVLLLKSKRVNINSKI